MNIEDFIIPKGDFRLVGNPFPGRHLDYDKVLALSDEDFAKFYFLLMDEYREKDGWWKDENSLPKCSHCNKEIPSPRELRRYHGMTLLPDCFKEVYEGDNFKEKGIIQKYWSRVLAVNLNDVSI